MSKQECLPEENGQFVFHILERLATYNVQQEGLERSDRMPSSRN